MIVFGLGILSLFRLSHFKAELLKVFDSRQGFTFFIHFITKIECWEIPYIRLKWYGIEPIEETKARKLDEIYGKDCDCEFDQERDFKCNCAWNKNITLIEQQSFQDLRIVSKLGINRSCLGLFSWSMKNNLIWQKRCVFWWRLRCTKYENRKITWSRGFRALFGRFWGIWWVIIV